MNKEKPKTILLVEDEAIIAITNRRTLEKYGYIVIIATTGEKAVETFVKTLGIDLILMDIDLGAGIDGTEAAALILKDCDIPVVFLSSHTEPEIVEKTEKITSYGYVVKNSSSTVLDASIKMAFKLFAAKKGEIAKATALEKSEMHYRTLFTGSRDGFVTVNEQGDFLNANPAYCAMLGYSLEELRSQKTFYAITPEKWHEWENVEIWNRRLMQQGFTGVYEKEYIRKDGSIFPVELQAFTVLGPGGGIQYIWGWARDITQSKQAEQELKAKNEELEAFTEELNASVQELEALTAELNEANETLRGKEKILLQEKIFTEALFESIPGYLYVYDEQGHLIRWNKKHEEMTGYSAEELSQMTMDDWFEGEDAVRVAAAVAEVFATGYGEVDANLLIKGGGKLLIHSNGVRLTIDGKTYFTGVGIDISNRKLQDSL